MKTLFESKYLVCYFDEDEKIVFHKWLGKAKGEDFRGGLMKVREMYLNLKKNSPVLHWLGDTRLLSVLPLEDQKWLDETWNELLFVKAGVKSHAVIIGNDIFAKYAMEKFKKTMNVKYAGRNILLETFSNEDEAYKWFQTLNASAVVTV
jgi:hypothetical protein